MVPAPCPQNEEDTYLCVMYNTYRAVSRKNEEPKESQICLYQMGHERKWKYICSEPWSTEADLCFKQSGITTGEKWVYREYDRIGKSLRKKTRKSTWRTGEEKEIIFFPKYHQHSIRKVSSRIAISTNWFVSSPYHYFHWIEST